MNVSSADYDWDVLESSQIRVDSICSASDKKG